MADSRSQTVDWKPLSVELPEVRYVADYYLLIRKPGEEIFRSDAMHLIGIQRMIIDEREAGAGRDVEFEIRRCDDRKMVSASGGRWGRR